MDYVKEMSNEDLIKQFEWVINRISSYSASGEYVYKERLQNEVLLRLNSKG